MGADSSFVDESLLEDESTANELVVLVLSSLLLNKTLAQLRHFAAQHTNDNT